jgi:small conductance mechanosensitive channel
MEQEIQTLTILFDNLVEFVVAYGFQILGALVVLFIGLKAASWAGRKTGEFGTKRDFDPTLTKFASNVVRIFLIAVVAIITLSNFGITIAPLVALAGAAAFGGTLALQGPLSNYGAGIAIILTRPFAVGSTIQVQNTFGVVEEISLAATVLTGEDGERITVPNKEIVGQIIVNSHQHRVVETRFFIAHDQDSDKAIEAFEKAIAKYPAGEGAPGPQVGVHDFTYGGIILGARFWVPSLKYYQSRYAVNREVLGALEAAGISLVLAANPVFLAAPLSPDDDRGTLG